MNKITQYINERPKLKRLAKILGIVAILFSFLFNALIVCSLIYQAANNESQQSIAEEYHPQTKGLGHTEYDNRVFFCVNDMTTFSFLDSLTRTIQYKYDNGTDYKLLTTNGESYQRAINLMTNAQITTDCYFCYGNTGNVTINQKLTKIYIDKGNNGQGVIAYHVYFYTYYDSANPQSYFGELYYELYTNVAFDGETMYNTFDRGTSGTSGAYICSASTNIAGNYILIDSKATPVGYDVIYSTYTYYVNRYLSEDNYNFGYEQGFSAGKVAGYEEGYQVGSTGINSNPFNLIANAFGAVANVLNINIFPGFTLGTLIAVPLVVIIIIVLFKMFRG